MTQISFNTEILDQVSTRQIKEVMHFTTNPGLLGIFATGAVLSRDRLNTDRYVEHIYTPNCSDRLKDADWTDYVNMSISRVNGRMLGVSKNWHIDHELWWSVLAFDSELLGHDGVYFTTTNNTYPCVKRNPGVLGFSEMFAHSVEWGYYGSQIPRPPTRHSSLTTDLQAEVLYPGQVSLNHLRSIYVYEENNIDYIESLYNIFPTVPKVPVAWRPEVFT